MNSSPVLTNKELSEFLLGSTVISMEYLQDYTDIPKELMRLQSQKYILDVEWKNQIYSCVFVHCDKDSIESANISK